METWALLKRYHLRPSKGLGQNFLVDDRVLARIVEASGVGAQDVVLEVGPGLGLLTRRLAERAGQVVAVELDRKMLAILRETCGHLPNVHLVEGDILRVDPVQALRASLGLAEGDPLAYHVVANLPYYITSAALRHLLSATVRPQRLTLMVQYEVARRIVAPPGELSLLAISVQVYGTAEIAFRVPAGAFYPRPKVDSAVLRIHVHTQPRVPTEALAWFFQVVQAGFGQKRKQLHNSLAHNLRLPQEVVLQALAQAGLAADRRPQTCTLEEWMALARALPRVAA